MRFLQRALHSIQVAIFFSRSNIETMFIVQKKKKMQERNSKLNKHTIIAARRKWQVLLLTRMMDR